MTCTDCIHHKSCFNMAFRCGYKAEALDGAETCEDFKNKADFVEVVRCKDCKYCELYLSKESKSWQCVRKIEWVKPTDFCSYGVRK